MTHTGLSAEAVEDVLEPLGWRRRNTAYGSIFEMAGGRLRIHVRRKGRFRLQGMISVSDFDESDFTVMAPALAALSRLLGDTGHAAPEPGEGE